MSVLAREDRSLVPEDYAKENYDQLDYQDAKHRNSTVPGCRRSAKLGVYVQNLAGL